MKESKIVFFTFVLFSFCFLIITSCGNVFKPAEIPSANTKKATNSNKGGIIDCPEEIAAKAFEYAMLYDAAETEYGYGAQDPLRAIRIDCSGLVIMCYTYALEGTDYRLLEPDMASAYMYEHAATITDNPRHGDLIFMGGDNNDPTIFHIGIFDRFEGDEVYFIDSTSQGNINGVSARHYKKTNRKIKAYGIMKLKS